MTVIFALSMISFTIGNLVAGKLLKRHNVRFVMTVAIAFLLVGFIGSALVDGAASLPAVWCTYGVIASVGIGFVYNVIVPTAPCSRSSTPSWTGESCSWPWR